MINFTSRLIGIIPALAGNTSEVTRAGLDFKDHPRSRGEYSTSSSTTPPATGSSPLSRGILRRRIGHQNQHRIIPALAGNTPPLLDYCRRIRDHPRSRGEYSTGSYGTNSMTGSSPLSRGILLHLSINSGDRVDHPRSRGEYGAVTWVAHLNTGSSPLSRGIRS